MLTSLLAILLPVLAAGMETPAVKELAAVDATWNDLRLKPDVAGLDTLLVDETGC